MASLLCPGTQCMWNLYAPFKNGSLFPSALWSSWSQALLFFNQKCFGGSSSRFQTLRLGRYIWDSEFWLLWENWYIIIVQFVGCCFKHRNLALLWVSLSYHLFEAFFFVFGCRIYFLVGYNLFFFLSVVVQQLVLIMVFSQEEVSSRYFYSLILSPIQSRRYSFNEITLVLRSKGKNQIAWSLWIFLSIWVNKCIASEKLVVSLYEWPESCEWI